LLFFLFNVLFYQPAQERGAGLDETHKGMSQDCSSILACTALCRNGKLLGIRNGSVPLLNVDEKILLLTLLVNVDATNQNKKKGSMQTKNNNKKILTQRKWGE
jgi:hypothetical protein